MNAINAQACADQAEAYFLEGYACAQSVFMAFAPFYDIEIQEAARRSCGLGAGVGRLREICGAVSAASLVLSLEIPFVDPQDSASKTRNYAAIQSVAYQFEACFGTYICGDLLGVKRGESVPEPEVRTEAYYAERPCAQCVKKAAYIVAEKINELRSE